MHIDPDDLRDSLQRLLSYQTQLRKEVVALKHERRELKEKLAAVTKERAEKGETLKTNQELVYDLVRDNVLEQMQRDYDKVRDERDELLVLAGRRKVEIEEIRKNLLNIEKERDELQKRVTESETALAQNPKHTCIGYAKDFECPACAIGLCPHSDDEHLRDDGCPSCRHSPNEATTRTAVVYKRLQVACGTLDDIACMKNFESGDCSYQEAFTRCVHKARTALDYINALYEKKP